MIQKNKTDNIVITDVLNNSREMHHAFFSFLKEREPLKIIDVGCRVPINLFILYHIFDCEILKGFDKETPEKCLKYYIHLNTEEIPKGQIAVELNEAKSFFDLYSYIYHPSETEKKKITSEAIFNQIFLENFEVNSIELMDTQQHPNYDLIIASNILHCFQSETMEKVLRNLKQILHDNGLIIIRVQKNSTIFDYKRFLYLLLELFHEGEVFEVYKKGKWSYSVFINKSGLISF